MSVLTEDPHTITIHVPIKFNQGSRRRTVVSEFATPTPTTDGAVLRALARAYRWRTQIENGEYQSITELAKAKRVNESYACRLLRLTLLCPSIVSDVLNHRVNCDVTLTTLMKPLPVRWDEQMATLDNMNNRKSGM